MSFSDILTKLNLVGVALAGVTDEPVDPLEGKGWDNLGAIFNAVTNVVLYVGIALTIIFLIMGGIRYITSGGDKEGAEAARSNITNAIIGFIVVVGAFALKLIVQSILGADITTPDWFTG